MFTVTEQAANALHRHLVPKRKQENVVMRILLIDGKWTWAFDTPRDDDQLYNYGGVPLVAIHQNIYESLKDETLDIRKTEREICFVLD
jgi:hypothetical protein